MNIRLLSTSIITKTKFLNLMSTQFLDKLGKVKEWVWAQRPNNTSAVMIVPTVVTPDGPKIVVTSEFRVPLEGPEIGFPAGLIDRGEDVVEAARRELKEETGLDLVKVIKLSHPVFNSAGLSDESISVCFVQASGTISTAGNEASEQIEVMLLSFDEIRELMDDKTKKIGSKAWIIFYLLCQIDSLQVTLKESVAKNTI